MSGQAAASGAAKGELIPRSDVKMQMGYHLSFLVNTVGVRFSSDEDGNRAARPHAPSLDSGGREIGVRC